MREACSLVVSVSKSKRDFAKKEIVELSCHVIVVMITIPIHVRNSNKFRPTWTATSAAFWTPIIFGISL